ncbi:hypothetical protein KEU06_13425 [Pseudaminobacter sp. 19-2017]|uniref:Secreted protein n=1 Tax=Pseudaminobacter soli (ex Zhang et al. 2022) TaxID=2831468 RepID=A0A942I8Q9_9HYPH|nr:hypothetical protein [Pseudaminobacter soli]MBS3649610.1 hypothetical protein [Pseudaminobacter soli]
MSRLLAAVLTLASVVSAVLTSVATASNIGFLQPTDAWGYRPAGHVAVIENHRIKQCGKEANGQAITCPQSLAVLPAVVSCWPDKPAEACGSTIDSHFESSHADVRLRPPKA